MQYPRLELNSAPLALIPALTSRPRYWDGYGTGLQRRFGYERFAMPDAAFRFLLQSFQATRQRGFSR